MGSEAAPHLLAGPAHGRGERPEQPEPFVRGVAWPGTRRVPYPRADPLDRLRLPGDTWQMASIPAGVRLEMIGDASEVEIAYRTETDQLGYRGAGAGASFAAWQGDTKIGEAAAQLGEGRVRLPVGPADSGAEQLAASRSDERTVDSRSGGRTIVHLPEGMRPTVLEVRGVAGDLDPAPPQPRWVVYGDSVAEGWIASEPGLAWPARAGRALGLDVVNLGYAGAARGEIASAEQVASLAADFLTVCHGTNCWTRIPHSASAFGASIAAWLEILRQAHPDTPLLVVSPVVRPDAEDTPNRLGATLHDLRSAMEEMVAARIDGGDERLRLVRGLDLIEASLLGDGVHPDDEGHRRMASRIGAEVRAMMG